MATEPTLAWAALADAALVRRLVPVLEDIAAALWARRDTADPSLASGLAGGALFLGYLGRYEGSPERLEQAFDMLERALEVLAEVPSLGCFGGYPGIAWCMENLGRRRIPAMEGDPGADLEALMLQRLNKGPWRGPYDLIDGLVGLGMYGLERLPRAGGSLLTKVLAHLEALAVPFGPGLAWITAPDQLPAWQAALAPGGTFNLGMAHGLPGVVALLGRMAAAGVEPARCLRLLEGGTRTLIWRMEIKGGGLGAWAGAGGVTGADLDEERVAWCYGRLGASFAVAQAACSTGNGAWRALAHRMASEAAVRPMADSGVEDAGICHGAAGNAHLFNRWFQMTGDDRFRKAALAYLDQTLRFRTPEGGCAGFSTLIQREGEEGILGLKVPAPCPGFLTGAAGVGLALLGFMDGDDPALRFVLEGAEGGKRPPELAASLTGPEVLLEEAEGYVRELIDEQILVPVFQLNVTGPEPLKGILDGLQKLPEAASYLDRLRTAQERLARLDQEPPGRSLGTYRALAEELAELPAPLDPERLMQVDLFRNAPGISLGPRVRAALLEGVDLLRRLPDPDPGRPLEAFAKGFEARYGDGWVPLLVALDEAGDLGGPSAGTGLSPLVEGLLPVPWPPPGNPMGDREAYMLRRIHAMGPGQIWDLTDEDLAKLAEPAPRDLPEAFACMAVLLADREEDLDAGGFGLLLEGFNGPSGARLLGRFCHGDPALAEAVKDHLGAEEERQPACVFAEIAHLPEGRMGNVVCRPALRRAEVPVMGGSGVPESEQIPLADLWVAVRDGRVVLGSRKLGRQVIPRLSSAHNYARGLGLYRFLGAIQDQDGGSWGWTWGALEAMPWLPQVRRGAIVLQRARWCVDRTELKGVLTLPPKGRGAAFQAFAQRRGIPDRVTLADGDNELTVDIREPRLVDTFLHLVAERPSFVLREAQPLWGKPLAGARGQRYLHELVVPFLGVPCPRPQGMPFPGEPPVSFGPGSEWLYLKLYMDPATADRILAGMPEWLDANLDIFDRWFFIRYDDPENHLRLRFHGRPRDLEGILLPRLRGFLAPFLDSGGIWRLQTDTYLPERARYGGSAGMPLCEELFHQDSRAVIRLLQGYPGDLGRQWLWLAGLVGVDVLLEDFGFSAEEKYTLLLRATGAQRAKSGEGADPVLGRKYREMRKVLDPFLLEGLAPPGLRPALQVMEERSRAWRGTLAVLANEDRGGGLATPLADIALSLCHMHLNRLLRSEANLHERVIYDFLTRSHQARRARGGSRRGQRDVSNRPGPV